MALPVINLDDLGYQQLLGILKSHIRAEDWSDHNPSDPGIALLELLSWLGEMDLYRLNRLPDAHRAKFLKLLLDPPVPVSAKITFERTTGVATEIPPGLKVATDFKNGRRFVYETFSRAVLVSPAPGEPPAATLLARAVRELENVVLGVTTDAPNQTFALPASPVLVDFAARAPAFNYDPNPTVQVGASVWQLRPFLQSLASKGSPAPEHFMVDEFENCIRFGDGVFGAIPAPGQTVTLLRCRVLEGPEALVAETQLKHLLNPDDVSGATLTVAANSDGEGGENFPTAAVASSADERIRSGLETFRNPTRLVTAADFERVATKDFNEFQRNFNLAQGLPPEELDTDTVQRAVALMNKKPPLATGTHSAGHVTLMVLPAYDEDEFEAAPLGSVLGSKSSLVTPSAGLIRRLLAYLEPRRLITTRLHVVGPELLGISAQMVVVIENQRNSAEMLKAVDSTLRRFLSITRGYDDGLGWPLGRAVRRSQLFRVLEDVAGVDHVESLLLSPANALADVALDPRQLPVWAQLTVAVKRA